MMTRESRQYDVLVDSREASVSYVRTFLAAHQAVAVSVTQTSQPTLVQDVHELLARDSSIPILISVHCITEGSLTAITRLLPPAQNSRKLVICSYDCFTPARNWRDTETVTFCPNPLRKRYLPAPQQVAAKLRDSRPLTPDEQEMVERIWTHYRLMVAIISRTAPLSSVCSDLVQKKSMDHEPLLQEKLRALRYHRLGEPDMAGGTYPGDQVKISTPIDRLRERIRTIAATDFNVLIYGESGVGKETAAWAIHELSDRRNNPFLVLNCAGMPDELLESEMFGYMKGSHNQADSDHPGLLETAAGGTIFLDELPEMSPRIQAKLLRFIESGEYRPLGSNTNHYANARIIGAGQPDRLQEQSSLRPDLKSRISQLEINIQPLRELESNCPGTIAKIAYVLLERYTWSRMYFNGERCCLTPRHIKELQARFCSPENTAQLARHEWRESNIRELNNLIRQWVVFGDDELQRCCPPAHLHKSIDKPLPPSLKIFDEELEILLTPPINRKELQTLADHNPLQKIKKAYTRHLYQLFANIVHEESKGGPGPTKVTQKQMAELLHVTENTISRYLN